MNFYLIILQDLCNFILFRIYFYNKKDENALKKYLFKTISNEDLATKIWTDSNFGFSSETTLKNWIKILFKDDIKK